MLGRLNVVITGMLIKPTDDVLFDILLAYISNKFFYGTLYSVLCVLVQCTILVSIFDSRHIFSTASVRKLLQCSCFLSKIKGSGALVILSLDVVFGIPYSLFIITCLCMVKI